MFQAVHLVFVSAARLQGAATAAAWQQVLEHSWEGCVAKDPESRYVGGRTLKWFKVKQAKYREGERGWEPKK